MHHRRGVVAYAGVEGVCGDGIAIQVIDSDRFEPVAGKVIRQKLQTAEVAIQSASTLEPRGRRPVHLAVNQVNAKQVREEKQDFVQRVIDRWRRDVAPHTTNLLEFSCNDVCLGCEMQSYSRREADSGVPSWRTPVMQSLQNDMVKWENRRARPQSPQLHLLVMLFAS